jgi:hypothetical protein
LSSLLPKEMKLISTSKGPSLIKRHLNFLSFLCDFSFCTQMTLRLLYFQVTALVLCLILIQNAILLVYCLLHIALSISLIYRTCVKRRQDIAFSIMIDAEASKSYKQSSSEGKLRGVYNYCIVVYLLLL